MVEDLAFGHRVEGLGGDHVEPGVDPRLCLAPEVEAVGHAAQTAGRIEPEAIDIGAPARRDEQMAALDAEPTFVGLAIDADAALGFLETQVAAALIERDPLCGEAIDDDLGEFPVILDQ